MINKSKGTRRFFYHYRRATNGMTVHFKKQCLLCKDVICLVPTETKWNKTQPMLVVQGFASSVRMDGETAIVE